MYKNRNVKTSYGFTRSCLLGLIAGVCQAIIKDSKESPCLAYKATASHAYVSVFVPFKTNMICYKLLIRFYSNGFYGGLSPVQHWQDSHEMCTDGHSLQMMYLSVFHDPLTFLSSAIIRLQCFVLTSSSTELLAWLYTLKSWMDQTFASISSCNSWRESKSL